MEGKWPATISSRFSFILFCWLETKNQFSTLKPVRCHSWAEAPQVWITHPRLKMWLSWVSKHSAYESSFLMPQVSYRCLFLRLLNLRPDVYYLSFLLPPKWLFMKEPSEELFNNRWVFTAMTNWLLGKTVGFCHFISKVLTARVRLPATGSPQWATSGKCHIQLFPLPRWCVSQLFCWELGVLIDPSCGMTFSTSSTAIRPLNSMGLIVFRTIAFRWLLII